MTQTTHAPDVLHQLVDMKWAMLQDVMASPHQTIFADNYRSRIAAARHDLDSVLELVAGHFEQHTGQRPNMGHAPTVPNTPAPGEAALPPPSSLPGQVDRRAELRSHFDRVQRARAALHALAGPLRPSPPPPEGT